jgi:dUTP pyrophosphatase
MRGFKIAKGYEDLTINLPKRSTMYSAGYDIETCEDLTINPNEIKLAKTGVKAFMQKDEVLNMYPRSSLPRTFGVTIPNNVGIVDADYYENPDNDGAIFVSLINFKDTPIFIPKGTRIAQGIFMKYLTVTDEAPINQTRNGGFGSTGH